MRENAEETQEFALMVLPNQTKRNSNMTEFLLWLAKELKSRYGSQNTSLENRQYSPFVDYDYVVSEPRTSFLSQIEPRHAIVVQSMEQLEKVYRKGILSKL
jgi:hypothetical protein